MAELKPAKPAKIDGTQMSDGPMWNSKRVPDGEYRLVIKSVGETTTRESGDRMWVYTLALKNRPTYTYPYNCPLSPTGLGFLGALYRALGKELKGKVGTLDPNKILGKEVGASMEEDEYQAEKGRSASKIGAIIPLTDVVNEPSLDGAVVGRQSKPTGSSRGAGGDDSDVLDEGPDVELGDDDDLDLDTL